jgi:hydroxymethylbilane synthase
VVTPSSASSTVRIGTRGSPLALYQANAVAALLQQQADLRSEIVVIKTSGDRLAEVVLADAGGKRLFVKEIEDALLAGEIDLAVHSSKDLPADLPNGLQIAAVLPREDALDAIVLPGQQTDQPAFADVADHLGTAPVIGTSSIRRIAQLTLAIPGARFLPVRGNLDTRLRKLDSGGYDALVLAAAGLRRLGLGHRISSVVPIETCIPAPGQGIIAIEARTSDASVRACVERITHRPSALALSAERAVVAALGGGCQMPIGAHAEVVEDRMSLTAVVIAPDGSSSVRAHVGGMSHEATLLGQRAGDELLARGAGNILSSVRQAQGDTTSHT